MFTITGFETEFDKLPVFGEVEADQKAQAEKENMQTILGKRLSSFGNREAEPNKKAKLASSLLTPLKARQVKDSTLFHSVWVVILTLSLDIKRSLRLNSNFVFS